MCIKTHMSTHFTRFLPARWQIGPVFWMNDLDRPRKNALPAKRQTELVELLQVRGQMLVADVADYFQVSEDTVRRDLDSLAERGALTRTHGGAVAMTALVHRDSPFLQRLSSHTPEKQRLAKAAAALIG